MHEGIAHTGSLNHGPRGGVRKKSLQHARIQAMTAANGPVAAQQRIAREREIAYGIKHLMAHELLRVAQALAIENAVIADGDCIIQRCAKGEPGVSKAISTSN
jgi:hypothetical protein